MVEIIAFAAIATVIISIGFISSVAVILLKKRRSKINFPILIDRYNVRCNYSQFSKKDIENQIMFLEYEWPESIGVKFKPDGVLINFDQEKDLTHEPKYNYINKTLDLPCKGAKFIWETGLSHELSHYIIDPNMTTAIREGLDHPFFDEVFSDSTGCVRRSRVAMGMHPYPGMRMPKFYL